MAKNYSMKNLQKASFQQKDLAFASFAHSDLRGANFSGSDLTGADFSNVRTGITPKHVFLIFLFALAVSMISGYVAMLAGQTIQGMVKSNDRNLRIAGIATLIIGLMFIVFSVWRGVGNAIRQLVFPAIFLAIVVGVVNIVSGIGTGEGVLYLILAMILLVIMFVVGTIARAAAGSLSNILFIVVALSGGMFGKSVGGGIGTVVMAIGCALISKRALAGKKGFEVLRKIAWYITSRFGTSFRNSKLNDADFSHARIHNSDFSNVDVSHVKWSTSKRQNCIIQTPGEHGSREHRDQKQ